MRHLVVVKLTLIPALAAVALASAQIRFETSAIEARAPATQRASLHRGLEADERTMLTDADLVETHARPLFSQNRRPYVARPPVVQQSEQVVVEAVVEPPPSLPRRLSLIGTNAGASMSVLVRNRDSAEVRWLAVGEIFDGWRLAAVSGDSASFTCAQPQAEDCHYRLELYSEARSE